MSQHERVQIAILTPLPRAACLGCRRGQRYAACPYELDTDVSTSELPRTKGRRWLQWHYTTCIDCVAVEHFRLERNCFCLSLLPESVEGWISASVSRRTSAGTLLRQPHDHVLVRKSARFG